MANRLLRRLALASALAIACYGMQLPFASAAPSPSKTGRVLVNAPDPGGYTGVSTGTTLAIGTAGFGSNHVPRLTPAAIDAYQSKTGATVIDSRSGLLQTKLLVKGHDYMLTLADGVLPSGREVVGLSVSDLAQAAVPLPLISLNAVTTVSAATQGLGMCSYTWNNYDGSQSVYICVRDVQVIAAMAAFQLALIAIFGGVVGAMVAAFLALLLAIGYWYFQNPDGSLSFTIPAWTIWAPPGGYAYTSGSWYTWSGQTLYYYNQWSLACWSC